METRIIAGRYRLTRPLGRGGMGTVWLGEDELAERQVAVKELRAPGGISDAERDVFGRRSLQEARSAARLSHPGAVTLHDVIPATASDDAVYLIMEYVNGASLAQVIEQEGPLAQARVADIARQLLGILGAAHALGIVHRDIKPANILITADGQVKLTDFGIAHVVGGTRLTGSGVIGTPGFLAPEQLQGFDITPAVDLWALGVTLFAAIAGRNPFERDTTAAIFHAILMADLPQPPCPPPLGTVIAGLLARDPGQRMTTDQARQVLTGQTAWSSLPGTGAGPAGGDGSWGPSGSWPGQAAAPGPGTRPVTSAYQASQPTTPGWAPDPAGSGPQGPAGYTGAPQGPGGYAGGPQGPGGYAGGPQAPAGYAGGPQGPGGYTGEPQAPAGYTYPGGPAPGGPPAPGRRRRTGLIAAGAAVVVVGAAAAVVLTMQGGSPSTPAASSSTAASQQASPAPTQAADTSTAATPTTTAAGPNVVPAGYLGSWTGTLTDNSGISGPQKPTLKLTGGAVNAVAGTANYPEAGCTYNLQLISAQPNRVELQEQVTSGPCLADYAVLTMAGSQINENVYLTQPSGSSSPTFTGKLSKTG